MRPNPASHPARRTLGRTGLQVSTLCLGGNVFGWTIDEAASFAVLDAFFEGGGTFIDTADVYSKWVPGHEGGESEAILGRWMAARAVRDRVVIATKVGHPLGGDGGLRRGHVERAVEASLRRLQIETIDLYYAHIDDRATSLDETVAAFDSLVTAGKVRVVGASQYDPDRLAEALAIARGASFARYDVLQPHYNLVARDAFEGPLRDLCARESIAVAPFWALAAGFLTGKYREGAPLPSTPRAQGVTERYFHPRGWRVVAEVERVAKGRGVTMAQVAVAWVACQPTIVAPIASATSPAQVNDLLAAVAMALSDEELAALDAASSFSTP